MGLIAVRLDAETEAHLADILAHDKTDRIAALDRDFDIYRRYRKQHERASVSS